MFITDTFIIEEFKILEESKSNGTMRIAGIFQRADVPNNNRRVYERSLLEREMGRLSESISERRLLGELDHPSQDSVSLRNVSHLITKLSMRGKEMIGEAEILNTPAGQVAQALIRGGVKLGISSRGMGSLSEGPDGTTLVNEDFKLVTFDLVADPSTKGAYPGLVTESKSSQFIEETSKITYDKALAEKVFITKLRRQLNKK